MFQHRAPWWLPWLAIALSIVLGVCGFWYVHSNSSYQSSRRGVSDAKDAVTAQEQAASRLLVCTGLESLPQTAPVRALEAIPYPIYGEPTDPYCPAPGAAS